MVFKRRDRRSVLKAVAEFFYPRGGWTRAFHYVKHRLTRLPGTPETVARGIWAGVFTAFTPFYGLHFVIAFILARLLSGNLLAALLGTFFGNPLTYVPIGVICLKTGHYLLGTEFREGEHLSFAHKFADAGSDLWFNFWAISSEEVADWGGLSRFFDEVLWPYMIGGIVPGIIAATVCYYLTVPLVRAYQKRRAARIQKKITKARAKAVKHAARHAQKTKSND